MCRVIAQYLSIFCVLLLSEAATAQLGAPSQIELDTRFLILEDHPLLLGSGLQVDTSGDTQLLVGDGQGGLQITQTQSIDTFFDIDAGSHDLKTGTEFITLVDEHGAPIDPPIFITGGGEVGSGDLDTDFSFGNVEPTYVQDLRDAWEQVEANLRDEDCRIARLSLTTHHVPTSVPEGPDGIYGTEDDETGDFDPSHASFSYTIYYLYVHCEDRRSFKIQITVDVKSTVPEKVVETFVSKAQIISVDSGGNKALAKGTITAPLPALPPGQAGVTLGLQSVAVYLGVPESGGGFSALPTVIWFDAHQEPQELLQLPGPAASFASDMQLCSEPNYEHLWLAWTSEDNRAQVAYVANRDATIMDLGPTSGTTELGCDVWGNAVAAFATASGNSIDLVSFDAGGDTTDTGSLSASGGFAGMTIAMDMNDNGEIRIAHTNQSGDTILGGATLSNAVALDMSFAGSWNSPFFDGEGFIWDIAEVNGVPTLVLYYFSYRSNNSGRQAWMVGSAPIINGVAIIPAAITEGATFGSAFDPDDVNPSSWGEIEVRVGGCGLARMIMRSPSFGDHEYPIEKFTATPLDLDGICADGSLGIANDKPESNPKAVSTVDGSFSGSWFSPARNFEGFIFEVVNVSGNPTLVVYWFSYSTTGNGRQLWLVGTGAINGDTANVSLVSTSGGSYGPGFDPSAINATPFGSVTVTFDDCDNATIMYSVNGGESGSFSIQRLAALPSGAGGVCGT